MTARPSPSLKALSIDLGEPDLRGWRLWSRIIGVLLRGETIGAVVLMRLAHHFEAKGHRILARQASQRLRWKFGCMINRRASIGPGFKLPHPVGIVIGEGVTVGAHCTVYQHVTLGGARMGDWQAGQYPTVGDNVVIFAGAKVVGALSVGSNAVIGANAVVTRSVPPGDIAVGIPAVVKAPRARISATAA